MPGPSPRDRRHAHRPRWRTVPDSRNRLPGSTTMPADRLPQPGRCHLPRHGNADGDQPTIEPGVLRLPQVFTPTRAAEILRSLGLAAMTETALRSRAYRRQIPFHLNGRKIIFTEGDLREIAEGQAQRPETSAFRPRSRSAPKQQPRRPSQPPDEQPPTTWRAKLSRTPPGQGTT